MRFAVIADGPDAADRILGTLPAASVSAADIACMLLDSDIGGLDAYQQGLPVETVAIAPNASLQAPPDQIGPSLLRWLRRHTVVLLDSSQPSRDLAGWLASNAGAQVVWGVESVGPSFQKLEVARVVNGGKAHLLQEVGLQNLTVVLTRSARPLSADLSADPQVWDRVRAEREILEFSTQRSRGSLEGGQGSDEVPLATAQIVVTIGRGIGGPEKVAIYRALARRMGAALGATRVAVDHEWLPFSHQVGQTGSAVAPDLYIAFGVSGAVQHVVGMRDSRVIAVVNTDSEAPLCRIADLVVRGDATQVAGELLRRLAREESHEQEL